MRQILIGALLLATCQALAACSGEEFAPREQPSNDDGNAGASSQSGSRNGAATGNQTAESGEGGAISQPPSGPSAGSAAGGSPGAAGSGTTGGASSASAGDDECAARSVKFRMLPSPDLPPDFLCDAGCGSGWLTITDSAGATVFSLFSACGTASCELCEPVPCAAGACQPTPLHAEGRELLWDGTFFKAGSCGNNLACQRRSCMPEGVYRAKACVALNAGVSDMGDGCMPKDDASLCAEAEFDFPTAREVELILQK